MSNQPEQEWGEPMMPVPRFGRGPALVPVRWVASVVSLTVGTTLIVSQFIIWAGWNREPIPIFMTVAAGSLGLPAVMRADVKRQER